MFKTPITAAVGLPDSACSVGCRGGITAAETGLDLVAIMPSLCAVAAAESRCRKRLRGAVSAFAKTQSELS
jgi:hypothetical protein